MTGVYGSILLQFPELFQDGEYFEMEPRINAGYDKNNEPEMLRVVVQNFASSVTKSNQHLVNMSQKKMWCDKELIGGRFVKVDNTVFRLVRENEWGNEGGFFYHIIERLIGDNGANTESITFNTGKNAFS